MGVRTWLGNKLFNIDKIVGDKMKTELNNRILLNLGTTNRKSELLSYRQTEYSTWAKGSPEMLLEFYKTTRLPSNYNSRTMFWDWVGVSNNTPKLHFPLSQSILNHMKSLLFSEELEMYIKTGNDTLDKSVNEDFKKLLDGIDFYELLQTSSYMETYSGTVGCKPFYDLSVRKYPITEPYPAERIEFTQKYNIAQEIIFKDYFEKDSHIYTLLSKYGKGYIDYELLNAQNNPVALTTLDETANLKRIEFRYKGGLLDLMMAIYKKNRSVSHEFPDSMYGGSDFEGLLDVFHNADELYSLKSLYARRTRPIMSIHESELKYDDTTKQKTLPKEWEYDMTVTYGKEPDKVSLDRKVPEIHFEPYTTAILEEMKTAYQKIGMAYTSVGLEAHSANISGAALNEKEKSTLIVRANKIKLWKKYLKDFMRLMMIYSNLDKATIVETEEAKVYNLSDNYEYDYQVEFPTYRKQSFNEKLDEVTKAVQGKVMDIKTAVDILYGNEYDEDEKREIVLNSKLENGTSVLPEDING
jgi:hypothetical protein